MTGKIILSLILFFVITSRPAHSMDDCLDSTGSTIPCAPIPSASRDAGADDAATNLANWANGNAIGVQNTAPAVQANAKPSADSPADSTDAKSKGKKTEKKVAKGGSPAIPTTPDPPVTSLSVPPVKSTTDTTSTIPTAPANAKPSTDTPAAASTADTKGNDKKTKSEVAKVKNTLIKEGEPQAKTTDPGSRATTPKATAEPPPPKTQSTWTLTAGHTIGKELQAWGEKAGWKIIWNMPKDWTIPSVALFYGDFQTAASDVIKTLAGNGALVRAQFFEGNKTVVISGPGAAAQ